MREGRGGQWTGRGERGRWGGGGGGLGGGGSNTPRHLTDSTSVSSSYPAPLPASIKMLPTAAAGPDRKGRDNRSALSQASGTLAASRTRP